MNNCIFCQENRFHNNLHYEKITWFEYGAVFPGKGGASIDHAHLHVWPYDFPIQQAVEADNKYSKKIQFSKDIFYRLAEKQPYLWTSDGFDSSSIYILCRQFAESIFTRCSHAITRKRRIQLEK